MPDIRHPQQTHLRAAATRLASLLKQQNLQIVFAESCTAGLVSATLGGIPGISAHLCGSAVVYQSATKAQWLGIPKSILETCGPVSRKTAGEMARRVLARTSQADVAVAVTGHLGPDAPPAQDGLVFAAVAKRHGRGSQQIAVRMRRLPKQSSGNGRSGLRLARQRAAALFVLEFAAETIAAEKA